MTDKFHENYLRDEAVIGSSDRSFGFVMTVVFLVISLLNWWHGGDSWLWTGSVAALFLATSLIFPVALRPLNLIWLKFGLLMHRVVSPIMMGLVFFGAVVPIGLIRRAMGKDPMRRNWRPEDISYWIERHPPGPAPKSMKDQF